MVEAGCSGSVRSPSPDLSLPPIIRSIRMKHFQLSSSDLQNSIVDVYADVVVELLRTENKIWEFQHKGKTVLRITQSAAPFVLIRE